MHQVIISYDKHADYYQVVVKQRKTLFGIGYLTQISRYRGPLSWTCNKALTLAAQYGVEVIDKTDQKLKLS